MKRLARGKGLIAMSEINIHKKRRKTAISRLEIENPSSRELTVTFQGVCLKGFAQEARASGNSGVLNRIPGNTEIQYKA